MRIGKAKLGAVIRYWRLHAGLTQGELAAMLAVTEGAVRLWERGLGVPHPRRIPALADALFDGHPSAAREYFLEQCISVKMRRRKKVAIR